jgi:hypothetical protein
MYYITIAHALLTIINALHHYLQEFRKKFEPFDFTLQDS